MNPFDIKLPQIVGNQLKYPVNYRPPNPFFIRGLNYQPGRVTQEAFKRLLEDKVFIISYNLPARVQGQPRQQVIEVALDPQQNPLPHAQQPDPFQDIGLDLAELIRNERKRKRVWHNYFSAKYKNELSSKKETLLSKNVALVSSLTQKLNQEGLSEVVRYFLSDEYWYVFLLEGAVTKKLTETSNARYSVLNEINTLEKELAKNIIDVVLEENQTNLNQPAIARLQKQFLANGLDLKDPAPLVLALMRQNLETNSLEDALDAYLNNGQLNPAQHTAQFKSEMLKYLGRLNLNLAILNQNPHAFDDFFGLAYVHAVNVQAGGADPLNNIFTPGTGTPWSYEVDYFEEIQRQHIIRENIRAAGALDYVYELGDRLGIFHIVDAIVLKWTRGELRISQGNAANLLYRYYKKRDDNRMTMEERGMVYSQVLNKGEAEMLSGMVVNKAFTQLWNHLMEEVVIFRQKEESLDSPQNQVSRSKLYRTIEDLQYNLTNSMVGKPLVDVHEMYAYLQESITILQDPEVIDQLAGGQFRTFWSVIDTVCREIHGVSPNISAARTVAIEGNKIFNFIADFDIGVIEESRFRDFIDSAELYINAASQITDEMDAQGQEEEAFFEGNDDFEDF